MCSDVDAQSPPSFPPQQGPMSPGGLHLQEPGDRCLQNESIASACRSQYLRQKFKFNEDKIQTVIKKKYRYCGFKFGPPASWVGVETVTSFPEDNLAFLTLESNKLWLRWGPAKCFPANPGCWCPGPASSGQRSTLSRWWHRVTVVRPRGEREVPRGRCRTWAAPLAAVPAPLPGQLCEPLPHACPGRFPAPFGFAFCASHRSLELDFHSTWRSGVLAAVPRHPVIPRLGRGARQHLSRRTRHQTRLKQRTLGGCPM